MPSFFIEAPEGISGERKAAMMAEITRALDAAYHIPDIRIFLREYPAGNVAQDGRIGAEPVRPVCFVEAPQLETLDARRTLNRRINAAVAAAYEGIANTGDILILANEYPLHHASAGGRLQSENPDFTGMSQAAAG